MKSHHQVNVLRIGEIRVHPNADKLEIIPIEGYQAVVGKGQFKIGDLAYYIPPDSIVPPKAEYEFLWKGPLEGEVPVRRRRITAKKLRGEWSEGLLMPVTGLLRCVSEGEDIAGLLGIEHYNPEEDPAPVVGDSKIRRKKIPTTWRGWVNYFKMLLRGERREGGPVGLPVYDVEAYKKYTNIFEPGERVIVSEKIHGSNARYSYREGPAWLGRYAPWAGHMYAGSRNLWKALDSTCAWRRALTDNPWIEKWCRAHPGYALYGEITPTQKNYDYGSKDKVRFFLFDIRTPEGEWMSLTDIDELTDGDSWRNWVPLLYDGPFNLDIIKRKVDGPSAVVGAKHIREGVVIRTEPNRTAHHLGRVQLKIVSNEFLDKDSK
jgi:RNA ligase